MIHQDCIFALSTPRGRSGVAVFRLSGTRAFEVAETLSGRLPAARRASLRTFRGPDGEVIDQGLLILFDDGASFTGEPSAEFQIHGSVATIAGMTDALAAVPGCRPADAGEFTLRALENGQLDLAQVEGLADLIDAETDAQRKQALRVMDGRLGRDVDAWRQALVDIRALIEATIDFSDEDIPDWVMASCRQQMNDLAQTWKKALAHAPAARVIRDGFEVALVGRPNVGKSTLLNYLAQRDVALVSDIPGTTRDVVEARLDIGGVPVTFLDTAGVRNSVDVVENMGVSRTKLRAEEADLRIFLSDPADVGDLDVAISADDLIVAPKGDLETGSGPSVSGTTGQGVSALLERVATVVAHRTEHASALIRARHVEALHSAYLALAEARSLLDKRDYDSEVAAEHVIHATRHLDVLIGRVDVETVLGSIFAGFCIGK